MNPATSRFEALIVPSDALERGGVEVLRASIIEGELHVTLRRAFEQPDHWGGLLSELVRRIARAYAADGKMKERDVAVRIRSSFADEGKPATAGRAPKAKAKKRPVKKPVKKTARQRKKR
jgi:hypothetical protein